MIKDSGKLAETQPPQNLTKEETEQVRRIIKTSFIQSFDFIIYISLALTWLGSLIALTTIEKNKTS